MGSIKHCFLVFLALPLAAAVSYRYQGAVDWVVTWKTNGTIDIEARDGIAVRASAGVRGFAAKQFNYTPEVESEAYTVSLTTVSTMTDASPVLYVMGRDASGKTVMYQNVGKPAKEERSYKILFTLNRAIKAFEIGLSLPNVSGGEIIVKDIVLEQFIPPADALAQIAPKGRTRWAATAIDRTYGSDAFDPRSRDTALKLLACAGVLDTRAGITWNNVEAERGKIDLTDYNDRVALFDHYGISLSIVCLGGTPSWASGKVPERDIPENMRKSLGAYKVARSYWAPKDWNDWERFVESAVRAGKGRVKAWEIINEPDLPSEGFMGTYEEYREYVRHAYIAAKRADPDCRIFLGAFVSGEWMPRLFNDGWAKYFDGMCTHPYANTGAGVLMRNNNAQYTSIALGAPKETWITEVGFQFGWKTGPGLVTSEEEKAREGRIALEGLAKRSKFIAWYTAQEKGNMFGLSRIEANGSLRPMPIYYEMGDISGRLKKSGGPIAVRVEGTGIFAKGSPCSVRLTVKNTSSAALAVKLWPVGFIDALGIANDGPNAADADVTLPAGTEKVIEMKCTPSEKASGKYAVGIAVICDGGNSLALSDIEIAK
ncbi:MAG: hypothetical protein AABZ39_13985 [Spirochaetota bacterium]